MSNSGMCDNSDNKNVIINTGNTYNIYIDRYNLISNDGEYLTRQYSENADLFMLNTLQSKFMGQRFVKNHGNHDGTLPLDNLPRNFKLGPSNSLIKKGQQPIPQKITEEPQPEDLPTHATPNLRQPSFLKANISSKCIDRLFSHRTPQPKTERENFADIEKPLKDFHCNSTQEFCHPILDPYVIFVSLICSYHSIEWFGFVEYIGSILISFESKCLADQNRSME